EWSYGCSPPGVIGVSPLKYQSCSGPTSSFRSAMKPSTDTTLCMITVPTGSPRLGTPDVVHRPSVAQDVHAEGMQTVYQAPGRGAGLLRPWGGWPERVRAEA